MYLPYGRNHSYPEASYIRYHQTSGTTGRPLKVLRYYRKLELVVGFVGWKYSSRRA